MQPTTLPGRLHVSLQPVLEEVHEPDYAPELPLVRFDAFADADRVFGWVRLEADRLTDLLNAHLELLLTDVETESLADGTTQSVDEVLIARSDLVAVHASGPRGDETRRHETSTHPVLLRAGDYLIGGHLHVPPGEDPVASLSRRPTMVPLTEAWIDYRSGPGRSRQRSGTLIVNRRRVDWIFVVEEGDLARAGLDPA